MNKVFSVIALLVLPMCIFAQDWFMGAWTGNLEVQGTELEMVFDFQHPEGDELGCFMTIPKQNIRAYPAERLVLTDTTFILYFTKFAVEFEAKKVDDKHAVGLWKQSGKSYPLHLEYTENAPQINRPQEPKYPFPYDIKGVSVRNESTQGVNLGATITIPKGEGPFPAVVLVSGSGPQDRNSEILAHKPFWVIADYLTKKGIIVLRYDDRGIGASSGSFQASTTVDFASDAAAAVKYLQVSDLPISKVGIMGHSEGGIVAPMVAADNEKVGFVVILAGPAVAGDEILMEQSKLIMEAGSSSKDDIDLGLDMSRKIYDLIKQTPQSESIDYDTLKAITKNYYDQISEETKKTIGTYERFYFSQSSAITTPWFRNFITYDPGGALLKLTQPVLGLYGSKDMQVSADQNATILKEKLNHAPTKQYKVEVLEGLNHLFQQAITGAPDEYGEIEETFNEGVLKMISEWILAIK